MKKILALIFAALIMSSLLVSYADTITVGNTEIEYSSQEELLEIYAAVKERIASEYKYVLFDADTYDRTTFIVGETFPAGRYYVYPVVVAEENTDLYAKLLWWNKDEIDEYSCTDYVCAEWCQTIELTDGMKIEFSWDGDQRGVCIAMQRAPEKPESLMDAFG